MPGTYLRTIDALRPVLLGAATIAVGQGCGLFEELQSVDSAEGEESAGSSEGDDEGDNGDDGDDPCVPLDDDACLDQDTLRSCSLETGEVTVSDCGGLCGSFVNFSCIPTNTGQHGCYCVEPGRQKILSCLELEQCINDCSSNEVCAQACFNRTDASTVRLYGSLVHCANERCTTPCREQPETCADCIARGLIQGSGDCSLERSVCDNDRNSDPWYP